MSAPLIQRRERQTVMDGRVAMFATEFSEYIGTFGTAYRAEGPFEVSASRDCVMVHCARLTAETDFEALQEALIRARAAHLGMRGGWGKPREERAPTLQDAATLALAELEAVQTADGAAPSTARAIETLRAAIATAGGAS